jgi:hypothetical protein
LKTNGKSWYPAIPEDLENTRQVIHPLSALRVKFLHHDITATGHIRTLGCVKFHGM